MVKLMDKSGHGVTFFTFYRSKPIHCGMRLGSIKFKCIHKCRVKFEEDTQCMTCAG